MKIVGLFFLFSILTRNPLLALLIILIIYAFIDRRFIGILPDFSVPLRRRKKQAELLRAVDVNPHNANAQFELGELYFSKGQYAKAVEYLRMALVKMQDSALIRFYLGASFFYLGQKEQSLVDLEESIRINPKVAHAYPYLYLLKQENILKNNKRAEELIDSLLRYGSVKLFFDAGKYFKQVGQEDIANKFFKEVLDIYRLSSPTLRRSFRRMAVYAKLVVK